MNRLLSRIRSYIGILCCLAAVNIFLCACVVLIDVCFGVAPQFGLPLFTAVVVAVGTLMIAALQAKRLSSTTEAQGENGDGRLRIVESPRFHSQSQQPSATFRSAIIIRRRPAARASNQSERQISYATSSSTS